MAKLKQQKTLCAATHGEASRSGLTLVEMLIAMAITLLMMAAVVTVFASVSDSVRNRRAAIEMNSEVRQVREVLQRDLAAATCPGLPWQRPESNHGYIELIEGPQSDIDPSVWLRDTDNDGAPDDVDGASGPLPAFDLAASTLPSSDQLRLPGATVEVTDNTGSNNGDPNVVTDGRGLGDWDDVLAFTARNENEPYVGRVPVIFEDINNNGVEDAGERRTFVDWSSTTLESQLAEVVWFAVENPVENNRTFYFGEPGFRTVYRRALLIAPDVNYAFNIGGQITGPGVVRVLGGGVDLDEVDEALASLIAFQERYDLSVRLEWDPQLAGGRWTIVANSLADLTKRENRYEHHGYLLSAPAERQFPFAAASFGSGYPTGNHRINAVLDPELNIDTTNFNDAPEFDLDVPANTTSGEAAVYRQGTSATLVPTRTQQYPERPLVFVNQNSATAPAAAKAILNEEGQIVAVTNGYVPLGGARRGQDIMLTDVLAFDMRVYDPDAPLLAEITDSGDPNYPGAAVEPGDAGWGRLVLAGDGSDNSVNETNELNGANAPDIVGRGAYVDPGYWFRNYTFGRATAITTDDLPDLNSPSLAPDTRSRIQDRLLNNSLLSGSPSVRSQMNRFNSTAFTPYRVYDTWSFHYENNGVNEDNDSGPLAGTGTIGPTIDEGTDGFDNPDPRQGGDVSLVDNASDIAILGPDDEAERETSPPFNTPLRGVQVTLRTYERDSRQVREVKVRQSFVPQ